MNRREFLKMSATSGVAALAASPLAAAGGSSKETRSEPKAMQDAKRSRLEALKELGPTITDFEVRRKKAIAGKRAAFYIDDVIFCFRDLAQSRPKSIWDHFYFAAFKEAHDKYGLKVQMNVFYRNDFYYGARGAEFTLSQMPDTWKAEFQAAKGWLRFGFHSYAEFPDYPWINASYDDISVSACGYNHFLPEQVAITRGTFNWLHDNATGCDFMTFGCGAPVLNLIRLEDIPARMGKVVGNEFLVHATHEEYWFKDYFAYQPDSREKLLAACKVVHDAGYEYSFIEEKVDW